MNKKLSASITICILSCISPISVSKAWATDADFSIATGFDYTSGEYGSSQSTDIISIPVIGMYQSDSWLFKLTVPYVQISGYGDVVLGGRRIKNPESTTTTTTATTKTTKSGLGDVLAAATYNAYSGDGDNFGIDLTGKIKFGTASTDLGTGENDYAAQVGSYRRWAGFTSRISLGYYFLGDSAVINLNNIAYGIFSGDYQFTDQTSFGAELMLAEKSSAIEASQNELTLYINHQMNPLLNFRIYALKGFSDGSADSGLGALVAFGF